MVNGCSEEKTLRSQSGDYGSLPFKSLSSNTPESQKIKRKYSAIQWMTIATLAFGNFCVGACVSLQAPFFPAEAEKKGATASEYGLVFGMYQLTIFLTAPFFAKIVLYTTPKLLLNAGIFTVGVTSIIFGVLDKAPSGKLFVGLAVTIRCLEGIGAAAMKTSIYTIIACQFQESLGTTFAMLETFLGIGLITGPTLGGVLYDFGGYGLPFYCVGVLVIVDAIVIFFVLPNVEHPSTTRGIASFKFWFHFGTILYFLTVYTSFQQIGFNAVGLEPHLRKFKLSGLELGLIFAVSGIIYGITAPVWGWLSDKKCNSRILSLIGCVIVSVSLLLIGPVPFLKLDETIPLVLIALFLHGLGLGAKLVNAFSGTMNEAVNRGLPADVGTFALVSSMIAASQSLGAFIGPSVGGYLLDELDFRKTTVILLLMELILIFLLLACFFKDKWDENNTLTMSMSSHLLLQGQPRNGMPENIQTVF